MKLSRDSIVLLVIIFLLSGCTKTNPEWQQEIGIGVFTDQENFLLGWYPESNDIKDALDIDDIGGGYLFYQSGEREYFTDPPKLMTKASMVFADREEKKGPLAGVYIGAEMESITKLYSDIKLSLDNDVPALIVFIDGFSFEQYITANKGNQLQFLGEHFRNKALSVYTPVTNAGYAAMITGTTPNKNGVHNRSYRDMKVESIFGYANSRDAKSILLEGDIKILNTEIEPVLHVDTNKNGDTDDEMLSSALKALEEGYDLIFVHFHGVDDRGHQYGPMAAETLDHIKKIDSWITELKDDWQGNIYVTADHGMHSTETGGDHGECRYEDMIVPYFSREK